MLTILSVVAAAVCSPGTTSIIGIRCGGFDQCMPTNRAGCFSAVAIWVIGMPEVFDAMIASSARWSSSCAVTSRLRSSFSGMASSTSSAPASAWPRSLENATEPPGADAASTRSSAPVAIW